MCVSCYEMMDKGRMGGEEGTEKRSYIIIKARITCFLTSHLYLMEIKCTTIT